MESGQPTRSRAGAQALVPLADASAALAASGSLVDVLEAVAEGAAAATSADAAIVRLRDGDRLVARAVAASSGALAAQLTGSPAALDVVSAAAGGGLEELSPETRAIVERAGARSSLVVPVVVGERLEGALELARAGPGFEEAERAAARIAAELVAAAVRLLGADAAPIARDRLVELTGDALAAAVEPERAAGRVVRLAARATGAEGVWLWRGDGESMELAAAHGDGRPASQESAEAIVLDHRAHGVDASGPAVVATFQLGQPPLGALQLRYPPGREVGAEEIAAAARFAVRAAHALRAAERARTTASELERSRALLDALGHAIAELSLAHALDAAVDRVTALLGSARVVVYLAEEDGTLRAARGGEDTDGHEAVAARLLALALGPARGRGVHVVADAAADPAVAEGLEAELAASGIEAAVAVPLVAGGDVIGLLAAYPSAGELPGAPEVALLAALGGQLAVAVENAREHERVRRRAERDEVELAAERERVRQLEAQHGISQSFTESMSLDATLDAVARSVTAALGIDAAAIQLPDARNAELVTRALDVRDGRLADVARTILTRPQPLTGEPLRRLLSSRRPLVLTAEGAADLGGLYALLSPFLEKGTTAVVLPIARTAVALGTLTLVSFQAEQPIDAQTLRAAQAITVQAALAIENAQLYAQQKQFADTMQRSLLPSSAPTLPGLELGYVYESAATVEVGGDVYDFLTLPDGRLAVVLGDVTGHGVDATADMAMAKYVFRSLARLHPAPGAFLAAANDVVAGEVATGKFITMVELVADAANDRLSCAAAGHPAPRLVHPDGSVEALAVRGLALGIDEEQAYEAVEVPFPPGSAVVLYTDGVIEARRGSELFGVERLDELLAARPGRPAADLARDVLAACRAFAGGELGDDCAVVVVARR